MTWKRIRDLDAVREQVRAAAALEEVIPDRYGIEVHGSGSENRKIVCPFHDDTDPSLGISIPKQVFYCHGCEASGDVFTFVQSMENLAHIAAIRALAEWAGMDLSEFEEDPTPEDEERLRLLGIVDEVMRWASSTAEKSKTFQRWVDGRRFDPEILREYEVGYATRVPPVDADDRLEFDKQGRWKGRVVVPIRDDQGRPIAFRTRAISGKGIKILGPSEDYPLEVPPVYGFYEARKHIRDAGYLILVEGEGDAWQMAGYGYRNVCATFGTHFGEDAARYLVDRGVRRVVLLPDADDAGRRFASRVSKFRYPGLTIQIATLDAGDPDEALLRDSGAVDSALGQAVHVLEYAIEEQLRGHPLKTITDRMDVLHEMQDVMKDIPELERNVAVQVLSQRLDMEPEGLTDYFREASTPDKLHNVQGERAVLCAALADEEVIGDVVLDLHEDDFYLLKHRQVFSALSRLYRTRDDVTRETVALYLRNRGHESTARYVDGLEGPVDGYRFLLEDVRDKAVRRKTREETQRLMSRIADTSVGSKDVLSSFSANLSRIVVGQTRSKDIAEIVNHNIQLMHERIANPEMIVGLDLGPDWRVLNRTIHGLQEGRYMVLAAPTGAGKSAVACAWARRFAIDLNEPVLFLTHEMSEEALTNRMIAGAAQVEQDKIVTGYLTEEEADLVQDAAQKLASSPLQITTRGRTFEEALAVIRHDIIRRETKVVVVDYIQLMSLADPRGIGRYQELGIISKGLLDLCQETGVCAIALAQINREGSKRTRSGAGDTGESFKIPQDSDIFYVLTPKTDEEVEAEGVEAGNRYGFLDKHRHGRDKVGCNITADLATMTIKEVHGE